MLTDTEAGARTEEFQVVATEHMDSLYRFALNMTGNKSDAQDLVQDTYLRAYRFFDKFEEGTNCKAWLITILRNTFINTIRHRRRKRMIYLSEMEEFGTELPSEDDVEDKIFGDLIDDDVTAAVSAIPAEYRSIVLLADMEGLSYREIADTVGCPMGTVMSRLFRGRRLLRKKLEGYASQYGYPVGRNRAK